MFAASTSSPVTFTAVLQSDGSTVTHPARRLTIALVFLSDDSHVYWADRLLADDLADETLGRSAVTDTQPQTAAGKVLWHFTMSLDGFVAGPNHAMDWMTGFTVPARPDRGIHRDHRRRAGRAGGLDAFPDAEHHLRRRLAGPVFVLTHHPEDAPPADGVTFLNCDVGRGGSDRAGGRGGKNLEVFSPTIGRQLLERGLIDEIDLHIAPVLLGDGIRLFDNPGGAPVRLQLSRWRRSLPAAVNLRYRPVAPN